MYSTIIKEEKEYFNSVLEKLKSEHKQIVADKQEIDLRRNWSRHSDRPEKRRF